MSQENVEAFKRGTEAYNRDSWRPCLPDGGSSSPPSRAHRDEGERGIRAHVGRRGPRRRRLSNRSVAGLQREAEGAEVGQRVQGHSLSPGLARALSALRRTTRYPESGSPVFCTEVGTPLDYSCVYRRVFNPAREAAGLCAEEVGAMHAFRRTLGSVIHASGLKSDRQLAAWLGHHDPAFTVRTYTGLLGDGLGDAAFLDQLLPVGQWGASDHPRTAGNGSARELGIRG
jgi:integrase